MGMNAFTFDVLSKVLKLVPERPIKMLSLGYPDILLSEHSLKSLLGDQALDGLVYRPDSAEIVKWHGLNHLIQKVPDPHDLFGRMGVELTVMDFQEVRGGEIICDLNVPLPETLIGTFSVVFDGGTMEHCFNIPQAVSNILSLAKVDGYIIHGNPLNLVNHGFYCCSPTFYHDFYTQNGHHIASQIVATRNAGLETEVVQLHPTRRQKGVPSESGITVVVKKRNDDKPFYPVQTKYLESPDLKR